MRSVLRSAFAFPPVQFHIDIPARRSIGQLTVLEPVASSHGTVAGHGVTLGGMPTIYDEVLYPSTPFSQTHPDRLATPATLFGMDPAPIHGCRVLELGCGDGGNLIPMAFENPGSQFLGLDSGAVAIRSGNQEIETDRKSTRLNSSH